MKFIIKILIYLIFFLNTLVSHAHNLAPALLKITLKENNRAEVLWKVSNVQSAGLNLMPQFPKACEKNAKEKIALDGPAVIYQWHFICTEPLTGKEISFIDLDRSRTTVMIVLKDATGKQNSSMISAQSPIYTIPYSLTPIETAKQYIFAGIEHLLTGWDHMLFVTGLLFLLFGQLRKVILAISCFTVGHSLSLMMATLGFLPFNPQMVEVLITITLILLALEILDDKSQPRFFSIQKTLYIITFLFGLIHGCGFASVLADALSNESSLVIPLLSFNLGIEIAQLMIIFLSIVFIKALIKMGISLQSIKPFFGYGMGALSSYWLIVRLID